MFVRRGSWEVCDGKESCQMPCVHRRRRTASRMDLAKTIWFAKTWTILWDVICGIIWPQRWRHTNRKTYLVIWICQIWVQQLPYESLLCLKPQQHTFAVSGGNKGTLCNIHWQVHVKVSQNYLLFVQKNISQVCFLECKYTVLFHMKTTHSEVDS